MFRKTNCITKLSTEDISMAKNEGLFFFADVNKIVLNPKNQNKHTPESIATMAESIKADRLYQPIGLRSIGHEMYQIIYGERRFLAIKQLGLEKIPAFLWDVDGEITTDMMRVIENDVREFDYLSECLELANLHRQEMSVKNIGKAIGQSENRIGEKIAVGNIPIAIIEKIRNSKVDWVLVHIISLLRLRQKDDAPLQGHGSGVKTDYTAYDYSEIDIAVDMVNDNRLKLGSDLQVYIADRRLEMEAESRERILAGQLAIIEQTQKEEAEKLIKQATEKVNAEKSEELQKALTEAQRLRSEHNKLLGQMATQTNQATTIKEKQHAIDGLGTRLAQADAKIRQITEQSAKEKQQLLGEAEEVATQKAQKIAKQQFETYKKQADVATQKTIKAIEDNAQKQIQQAQIKTQKTVQDGIVHFIKLCAELDAAINNLVLAQMGHMNDDQIKDVVIQITRLEKMINNVKPVISDYLARSKTKDFCRNYIDPIRKEVEEVSDFEHLWFRCIPGEEVFRKNPTSGELIFPKKTPSYL